jgi:hypothetical protein
MFFLVFFLTSHPSPLLLTTTTLRNKKQKRKRKKKTDFDSSFRILKGDEALQRGSQIIAETPGVSDSSQASILAADPCTRFLSEQVNEGSASAVGSSTTFGPAGFPRGTTVHLLLHPEACLSSGGAATGGGGMSGEGSAAGMGKAAASMLSSPRSVSSGVIAEQDLRAITGGWGDGGLAVSSNYPLLFWTDQDNIVAKDANSNIIGETMGVSGEVLSSSNSKATTLSAADSDEELEEMMSGFIDKTPRGAAEENAEENAASSSSSPNALPAVNTSNPYATALPSTSMLERAKYIPLRLSYEDRKVLYFNKKHISSPNVPISSMWCMSIIITLH